MQSTCKVHLQPLYAVVSELHAIDAKSVFNIVMPQSYMLPLIPLSVVHHVLHACNAAHLEVFSGCSMLR